MAGKLQHRTGQWNVWEGAVAEDEAGKSDFIL